MKRITLAAAAALTLATIPSAQAQYYDDDRPRRMERRYEERFYDEDRYERRRPRYDDERFERGPRLRGGGICVTARGNCMTRPAPLNTPCGCEVPGFGFKRGAIGG